MRYSSSQFCIYRCQVELSTDILFQLICINIISVMLASFGSNFLCSKNSDNDVRMSVLATLKVASTYSVLV